jgi:nitrogen fixation/metabolism regulation signal transduction histidine kinase
MKLFRPLFLATLVACLIPAGLVMVVLRASGEVVSPGALAAGGLASLAAALVLALLVARHVTDPVRELVRAALDVARGRFGREVRITARDEIGDLALTFNHMSRELAGIGDENQRLIAALERGYLDTIRCLASAIDA